MKNYAMLKAFTKYGSYGTLGLGAIAVILTLAGLVNGWIALPIALIAIALTVIGCFLMLVMVDLTRVIQDMLMPQ